MNRQREAMARSEIRQYDAGYCSSRLTALAAARKARVLGLTSSSPGGMWAAIAAQDPLDQHVTNQSRVVLTHHREWLSASWSTSWVWRGP